MYTATINHKASVGNTFPEGGGAAKEFEFSVAVVDFISKDAPKKLTDSLKSTGFAVVKNSPVSNQLISDVYNEWRDFMTRLNQDIQKLQEESITSTDDDDTTTSTNLGKKYYFDSIIQDGYFPTEASETAKGSTARDLKHYYQCYFPHGRYPDEVSDKARKLWDQLLALGKTLVGWIDEHMPSEIRALIETKIGKGVTLMDCVSNTRTMMRILHYPGRISGADEALGAVRAAAHEDINLITVLPAGSSRGLQVKSNQSDQWVDVPLVEGSIVINIGDMMQELSNGAYISTTHRVIKMDDGIDKTIDKNNKNGDSNNVVSFNKGDRMSTPCFIHLKKRCPLSNNFGSANHYLYERLVTLGVLPPSVLEDFLQTNPCGIMPGWNPNTE